MAGDHETERPDDAEGGPVKTFLEHLEDFRWVLIKSVVALFLAMLLCLIAANYVVQIIKWPLAHAYRSITSGHKSNRHCQLRHKSHRQFPAHTGTAKIAEPRHEPFRRRQRRTARLGTNQVLGWRVQRRSRRHRRRRSG